MDSCNWRMSPINKSHFPPKMSSDMIISCNLLFNYINYLRNKRLFVYNDNFNIFKVFSGYIQLLWCKIKHIWSKFESSLQWKFVNLQPFHSQRPTVPLWKGLDLIVNSVSAQETGSIWKKGFTNSKWHHLHRSYLVTICRVLIMTVY